LEANLAEYESFEFLKLFAQAEIYKIGAPPISESCLPLGMKAEDTRTKLVSVTPSTSTLLHRLLAISFASNPASEEVVKKNIAGYVCVTDVDVEKGKMTVLSPSPGPLPKLLLLQSDIQFMDTN